MSAAPEPGASGAAEPFPWDEAMSAAFGLLRLAPDAFWRMTPREFGRALAPFAVTHGEAPSRHAFETLLARFPDQHRRPA
ncbi:hypothetical protein GCM10011390_10590 [Aureimonas endophytica]|uniref:Phage protein (TIGR02216 family) n=1 Tax=Aureimonas endophytica TaxID=2027858 RepID=A0A917E1S8_9HYPH|nr:rcc01693 family protein [Aureimonas endophytica]GGD93724.1 hypothetical protein GCM10011390_10590 [Aureimonas endophytica]